MNVKYDKLDDISGKIVITLDENDYAEKVKKQLKEIAKHRPEPGFRPGKTPMGMLQKKYGDSVKLDVINKEVSDALFDYIRDNKLRVLGNPVPTTKEEFDIKKNDYEFEFEVGLAPEFEVKLDENLHIPYYKIQVSDEMINDQDKAFRRRLGKQEPGDTVNEDAVVKGVITELNEDGTVKEGGIVVENGIVAPKYFKDEEQRNIFAGKHVGDELVFNPAKTCDANPTEMSSMLNIDKDKVDEHKGDFRFDVKEIIVLNPAELGQEYYDQLFGADKVHTEEEYRKAISDMIANQLVADSNYRFSIDARKAVEDMVGELALPERILKDYLKAQNEEINDDNVDEAYKQSIEGLKWQLIADRIAEDKGLKLEEADLQEVARLMARNEFAKYGMTQIPDETVEKYATEILKDEKVRRKIANDAFEMKIFKEIFDAVSRDEKEVSVADFNALFEQPKAEA